MKKSFKMVAAIMLAMLFVMQPVCQANASAQSNMTKTLKYYKAGNIKKAKKYNKKLAKTAKEACVKKMSSKMKKAYRKVVKSYNFESTASANYRYLWDYYLTDIDNDKKAELVILYGSCEADAQIIVYKYKKGKAVKVASTYGGHSIFYAYPNHKGFIQMTAHMGGEQIDVLTLKNGKIVRKTIGSRYLSYDEDYFLLRQELKCHIKYDKNYNRTLLLGDLK